LYVCWYWQLCDTCQCCGAKKTNQN